MVLTIWHDQLCERFSALHKGKPGCQKKGSREKEAVKMIHCLIFPVWAV